jgi:hypothetical protein
MAQINETVDRHLSKPFADRGARAASERWRPKRQGKHSKFCIDTHNKTLAFCKS